MAYKRLNAEMAYFGIDRRRLAEKTGIRYDTLCLKLNGKSSITAGEAFKIKRAIGSDYPLEELFEELIENDDNTRSE